MTEVIAENAAQSAFYQAISGIGERHPVFGDRSKLYDNIGRLRILAQNRGGNVFLVATYYYPDNRTKFFTLTDKQGNLFTYKSRELGKFLWQSFYPSKAPKYFVDLVENAVKMSYLASLDSFRQPEGVPFEDKYHFMYGKNITTLVVPDETTIVLKEDFNRRKKKYLLTAAGLSFGATLVALRLLS